MFPNRFRIQSELCRLAVEGLPKTHFKKLNPHFLKKANDYGIEFIKAQTKSDKLGWLKNPYGSLAANLAYRHYLDIAPNNAEFVRPIDYEDLLAVWQIISYLLPELQRSENNKDGIDFNRLFGFFEAIKNHNVKEHICRDCNAGFMAEAGFLNKYCPFCQIRRL